MGRKPEPTFPRDTCGWVGRRREGTLAVPAVAGTVAVPEGVVDGTHDIPEYLVVLAGSDGRGWHPPEVRQDILLAQELPPVGGLVRANYGGVVFRPEPCAALVGGNRHHLLRPL